ncbi:hypothetical protein DB346_08460 [Verrucomicrobia bacterium LW23]|nr:hypothetical protein DB346_08460 [Verrucomicrobia bacterium LW23]
MAIDVTTIPIGGPALVKYDGATFYSKGDITLNITKNTLPIEVERDGKVDERVLDDIITVSFTPAGEFEALSVLFPYLTLPIGRHITGADKALVIHTFEGRKLTLHNAAITKMPNIIGSAEKTIFGDVEFTSFVKNNTERTDAASRWTLADEALTDATFDPDDVLVQSYTLAWGGDAPWNNMSTMEGFTLEWNLGLTDVKTDKDGIITKRLNALDVSVKAQPIGISKSDLLAKALVQGAGAARGRSLNASAMDLIITGTGVYIAVYGAALKTSPLQYGRSSMLIGQLEWVATRSYTAGAPNPLALIATEAPEEP